MDILPSEMPYKPHLKKALMSASNNSMLEPKFPNPIRIRLAINDSSHVEINRSRNLALMKSYNKAPQSYLNLFSG